MKIAQQLVFLAHSVFIVEQNVPVEAAAAVSKLGTLLGGGIGFFLPECGQTAQRYG